MSKQICTRNGNLLPQPCYKIRLMKSLSRLENKPGRLSFDRAKKVQVRCWSLNMNNVYKKIVPEKGTFLPQPCYKTFVMKSVSRLENKTERLSLDRTERVQVTCWSVNMIKVKTNLYRKREPFCRNLVTRFVIMTFLSRLVDNVFLYLCDIILLL